MKHSPVFILFFLFFFRLDGVTIVYNLRVAETTRLSSIFDQKLKRPHLAAAVAFNQYRRLFNGLFQTASGGIFNFVRTFGTSYVRMYTAFGHVTDRLNQVQFKRIQSDDILLYAGHGFLLHQKSQATVSGIMGIPTHKDTSLEGIQFGTGHLSVGAQVDASYNYAPEHHQKLFGAIRLIHFFPTRVRADLPILKGRFKIDLGNLLDVFLSHQKIWGRHMLNVGYDATLGFSAKIEPPLPNTTGTARLVRNSVFASYLYRFRVGGKPSGTLVGLSYSRDSKPKTIGSKYTVTMWAGWGLNF